MHVVTAFSVMPTSSSALAWLALDAACPGTAASALLWPQHRVLGVSADTLIFFLTWNQNWLLVWSAFQLDFAMAMNSPRPSLTNGPRGKAGADYNIQDG